MLVAGGGVIGMTVWGTLRHLLTARKIVGGIRKPVMNSTMAVPSVSQLDEQDVSTISFDGTSYVTLHNLVHLNNTLGLVFP